MILSFSILNFIFVKASGNIQNPSYNLYNRRNAIIDNNGRLNERQTYFSQEHKNHDIVKNNIPHTISHQNKTMPLYKQQIEDTSNGNESSLKAYSEYFLFYPSVNSDLNYNNIAYSDNSNEQKIPIDKKTAIENIYYDRINYERNKQINYELNVNSSQNNLVNDENIKLIQKRPHFSSSLPLHNQENTRLAGMQHETITTNQNEFNTTKSTDHYLPTSTTNQETNDILNYHKTYLIELSSHLNCIEDKVTSIESSIKDIFNILKDKKELNTNTEVVNYKSISNPSELSKTERVKRNYDQCGVANDLKTEENKKSCMGEKLKTGNLGYFIDHFHP